MLSFSTNVFKTVVPQAPIAPPCGLQRKQPVKEHMGKLMFQKVLAPHGLLFLDTLEKPERVNILKL